MEGLQGGQLLQLRTVRGPMPDTALLEPGVLVLPKALGGTSTILAPPERYGACGSSSFPVQCLRLAVMFSRLCLWAVGR